MNDGACAARLTRRCGLLAPVPPCSGVADPMLLRHHVILHDAGTPSGGGEAMRQAVVAQFGPTSCSMLVLNSRHMAPGGSGGMETQGLPQPPPVADIWSAAR